MVCRVSGHTFTDDEARAIISAPSRFDTWKEAHTAAVKLARFLNRDVGIWRANEFGKDGYNIRSLPHAKNRYGHELRCEVVSPSDPLSSVVKRVGQGDLFASV